MVGERHRRGAHRIPTGPAGDELWRAAGLPAVTYLLELTLSGLQGDTRVGSVLPWWALALLVLPGFLALLWRDRLPRLVFVVMLVQTVGLALLIPTFQPIAGLLVAMYAVARHRSRGELNLAVVLTVIPWSINSFLNEGVFGGSAPSGRISGFLMMLGFTVGFAILAWNQQRNQDMTALLSRTTEAEIAARIHAERLSIARELHDRVANSVAAIAFGVEGTLLREKDANESMRSSLNLTHDAARQAMSELRDVLRVLQASDATTVKDDLAPTLEGLLTQLETTGWGGSDVNITQLDQPATLRPEVEECAIRCLTEAITNAAKYGVTLVEVEIDWRSDPVVVRIHNANGVHHGSDPAMRGGVGLGSIIQRIGTVGGAVHLESDPEEFRLELRLPL